MEIQMKRCRVCGHLDVFSGPRCTSCGYLRAQSLFSGLEADAPPGALSPQRSPTASSSPPPVPKSALTSQLEKANEINEVNEGNKGKKDSEQPEDSESAPSSSHQAVSEDEHLLNQALESIGSLFERVKRSGSLNTPDRAELYESLLTSLLKVEREHLRRALLEQLNEEQRRRHMRHLTFTWVLGWLTGIAFYFALERFAG